MDLPKWVHEGLVARMKIMAGMDIAEKRLPQDGRLRVKTEDGKDVDFRVSTLRTLLRREDRAARARLTARARRRSRSSGFSAAAMEELRFFLKHQHGMILVVGPTGSGKTTTLSSAITSIKSGRTNIITIEDPIEYQIPGVNQTQVNEKAKLTFASALRAILRQDPDVILVGEIRDQETAKIAMQAAQTGHLVLSTLHTDDAPSTVTRLMDMGIEPYVIALGADRRGRAASRAAAVRRAAAGSTRRKPRRCARSTSTEADAAQFVFYRAVGCEECNHTGYRGRMAHLRSDARQRQGPPPDRRRRRGEDMVRDAAVERRHDHARRGRRSRRSRRASTTAEELLRVVTEVREMRTLCPGCSGAVGDGLHGLPALRPPAERRLPEVRPGAPGRVEVLPVLRDEHDAEAGRRSSCATSGRRWSCRPRTSLNSRTRIVEELTTTARRRSRRRRRRNQEGVPAEIARYHPDKVQHLGTRVPGDRGRARRRADRGVPDPDGSRRCGAKYDDDRSAGGGAGRAGGRPRPAGARPEPAPPAHRTAAAPAPLVRRRSPLRSRSRATDESTSCEGGAVAPARRGRRPCSAGAAAAPDRRASTSAFDVEGARAACSRRRSRASACWSRFVPQVDAAAVDGCWPLAVEGGQGADDAVCLLLLGPGLAPARDLALAIASSGGRSRTAGSCARPGRCERLGSTVSPGTPASVRALDPAAARRTSAEPGTARSRP